jgi:hypothetical protein
MNGPERPDETAIDPAEPPPTHVIVQAAAICEAGIVRCRAVVLHPDTWRILGAVSYDFEHVVSREAAEVVALTIGLRKARWLGARRVSAQTETRSVYELVLGQDETDDSVLRVYIACHRQEEVKLERVFYERITGDLNTAARQIAGRTSDELRKEVAA